MIQVYDGDGVPPRATPRAKPPTSVTFTEGARNAAGTLIAYAADDDVRRTMVAIAEAGFHHSLDDLLYYRVWVQAMLRRARNTPVLYPHRALIYRIGQEIDELMVEMGREPDNR